MRGPVTLLGGGHLAQFPDRHLLILGALTLFEALEEVRIGQRQAYGHTNFVQAPHAGFHFHDEREAWDNRQSRVFFSVPSHVQPEFDLVFLADQIIALDGDFYFLNLLSWAFCCEQGRASVEGLQSCAASLRLTRQHREFAEETLPVARVHSLKSLLSNIGKMLLQMIRGGTVKHLDQRL